MLFFDKGELIIFYHNNGDSQSWYWFAVLSSHWGLARIVNSLVQHIYIFSI